MKGYIKFKLFLIALFIIAVPASYAQNSSAVEKAVKEIVKKYDGVDKVDCVTVTKGNGLELVKMMFKKEFGKEFMKGVTSITIINYSDASENTCASLRKELDVFLPLLEEFDLSEDKSFSDNEFVRSFASESETEKGAISDFVAAIEKEDSKMVMYMAGTIKVE